MRIKFIYVDLNDFATCLSNFHWSNVIFTILVGVPTSVWMTRISVLVKVNGIRHYSFIDLILPCFSHKKLA